MLQILRSSCALAGKMSKPRASSVLCTDLWPWVYGTGRDLAHCYPSLGKFTLQLEVEPIVCDWIRLDHAWRNRFDLLHCDRFYRLFVQLLRAWLWGGWTGRRGSAVCQDRRGSAGACQDRQVITWR
jgi:hypothetical protein